MLRLHVTRALCATGILVVGAGLLAELAAQSGIATPSAYNTIKEAEIKADMFTLAGDQLRGREAGTLDEMHASMWIGEQFRKIGLVPMGEDGTWFQWFNMRRTRISTVSSSVRIGGKPLAFWTEVTPTSNTPADVVGTTVFAGDGRDSTINVQGRVAVVTLVPTSAGTRSTVNTPDYRAVRQGISMQGGALTRRGAAAVIIVADELGEQLFDGVAKLQSRGSYTVPGGASRFATAPGQETGRGGRAGWRWRTRGAGRTRWAGRRGAGPSDHGASRMAERAAK